MTWSSGEPWAAPSRAGRKSGIAPSCLVMSEQPTKRLARQAEGQRAGDMSDAIRAETITMVGHGGDEIEAYFARPVDTTGQGSVVVIHHMPGYDRAMKEIVRTFAVYGY